MNAWTVVFLFVLVANTVNVPIQKSGDCDIDMAWISFIPPHTMKITQLDTCGAIICWSQYVYFADRQQIKNRSRVCATSGYGYRLYPVDPQTNEEIKHEKQE